MARVTLAIDDHALHITVDAMVRAAGHSISDDDADVAITDSFTVEAPTRPTLLLAHAAAIPQAIEAMNHGVYDYVFLPLQPGDLARRIDRAVATSAPPPTSLDDLITLEEAEQRVIMETIRRCNNNRAEAARRLGIGRNTLWRKMKKVHPTP